MPFSPFQNHETNLEESYKDVLKEDPTIEERIAVLIESKKNKGDRKSRLTSHHYYFILKKWNEGVSAGVLADALKVSSGTITQIINKFRIDNVYVRSGYETVVDPKISPKNPPLYGSVKPHEWK